MPLLTNWCYDLLLILQINHNLHIFEMSNLTTGCKFGETGPAMFYYYSESSNLSLTNVPPLPDIISP